MAGKARQGAAIVAPLLNQTKETNKMRYLQRTYYILHDGFYGIDFAVNVKDARRAMKEHGFQKVGQITLRIPYMGWGNPEELEIGRRQAALWQWQQGKARQ
jgi:hypothetical protein